MVADRECDIYELFATAQEHVGKKAGWLIRAEHNRALWDDDEKGQAIAQVWEQVASATLLDTVEFTLPARDGRPTRTVHQTLYACPVKLRPP